MKLLLFESNFKLYLKTCKILADKMSKVLKFNFIVEIGDKSRLKTSINSTFSVG